MSINPRLPPEPGDSEARVFRKPATKQEREQTVPNNRAIGLEAVSG